jgi:RsiW-degrading membrane proteinase PrsW (M82 family)
MGMKKYVPSAVALAGTLAAIVVTLTSDVNGSVDGLFAFLIVGAGASAALLLFIVAFIGGDGRTVWPSLALGGLVVPVIVIVFGFVLFYPFLLIGEILVEWIEETDIAPGFTIEPWALALIAEVAILAPVVEEFLKPFGSILRRPKNRTDAFLFGAAAGIGFAIIETFLYASGGVFGLDWIAISVTRMVGVALHPFGAALIAVAVFERKNIIRSYSIAVATHALWNGAIAVTIIAFAEEGLYADNFVWGVAMFGLLTMIGTMILVGFLSIAVAVRDDQPVRFLGTLDRLNQPEGIGALALIATAVAFPFALAMLAFPGFLAL